MGGEGRGCVCACACACVYARACVFMSIINDLVGLSSELIRGSHDNVLSNKATKTSRNTTGIFTISVHFFSYLGAAPNKKGFVAKVSL